MVREPNLHPTITSLRMVPRQIGDVVRDLVTGEEGTIDADSVILLGRLGEMHATQEMLNRIAAEVERRKGEPVVSFAERGVRPTEATG